MKYFTKSAFKEALICPGRMNYLNDPTYANQSVDDEFLKALAEGGFQVGELAKIYYSVPPENDLGKKDRNEQLRETKRLLGFESTIVSEGAFVWRNCFCRVDILEKAGNRVHLVEVKAKSWNDECFQKDDGRIKSEIRECLYDVAFQKYIVTKSLAEMFPGKDMDVRAYLMLADKCVCSSCSRMNQYFKIKHIKHEGASAEVKVEVQDGVNELRKETRILKAYDVNEICDDIIMDELPDSSSVLHGYSFKEFVVNMSDWYCSGKKQYGAVKLSSECFKCPFYYKDGQSAMMGTLDGYDMCWTKQTAFWAKPYNVQLKEPLIEDLWGGDAGSRNIREELVQADKVYLSQIQASDIAPRSFKPNSRGGLNAFERRMTQIGLMTGNRSFILDSINGRIQDGCYVDFEGLRMEMAKWQFPLHMIDFETSAVALPFYERMHPYEQIAFQFSHHVIDSNDGGLTYTIRHANEWINTSSEFPNFDFVRALRVAIGNRGTVFRYASHENTILRCVRKQLLERGDQPDAGELITFIDSITHATDRECKADPSLRGVRPVRDMVDMLDVVKRYYYSPSMKGSNSIKVVLPAILEGSKLIREKYSKPIYGHEIVSKNFTGKVWVEIIDGKVVNPYKRLEDITEFLPQESREAGRRAIEQEGEVEPIEGQVNNGGAALWAYGLLQFCEEAPEKKQALVKALLRYCELDTLSMVFIWEYFNDVVHSK